MLQLIVPEGKRLVWYLAAEEYIARTVQEPTLMLWIVPPTVIFGRHQVMENEVNLPYCQAHHIAMYRRKSGGGCVYADEGNLMISYITPDTHAEAVFHDYLSQLVQVLQQWGFPAVQSSHNDILIADKKVSGNACYALPTGTIVHGTLLYSVDFDVLQEAITPSEEKLAKHGIPSVRQRVANLQEWPLVPPFASTQQMGECLAHLLCNRTRTLTREEQAAIAQIEQSYLCADFLYGK